MDGQKYLRSKAAPKETRQECLLALGELMMARRYKRNPEKKMKYDSSTVPS
jgi:hypothetical protein